MHTRNCVRGIGPIGGRPVDFIPSLPLPPPRVALVVRGVSAGLNAPLFFLAFCPFFPGRPDFALRFFLPSFRYSRVVFLLLSRSLPFPCSLSCFAFPSFPAVITIRMFPSLLLLLFTLVFSLTLPEPLSLSLYFCRLLLLFFVNHRLPRSAFVLFSELCHGQRIDLRSLDAYDRKYVCKPMRIMTLKLKQQ